MPIPKTLAVQLLLVAAAFICIRCASQKVPKTLGEQYSSFTYIPIEPLPVSDLIGNSCYCWDEVQDKRGERNNLDLKPLRDAIPDQTARLAISQIDVNGNVSYGPVAAGSKNSIYKVTFDYAASDVANILMKVSRIVELPNYKEINELAEKMAVASENYAQSRYKKGDTISIYDKIFRGESRYVLKRLDGSKDQPKNKTQADTSSVVIPVYIGFGVRLTATLKVSENKVDLSGLGAISAGVEANKISGTLVMQALGITGEAVRANFPVQSEINQATIQNALISVGSIKSLVDDTSRTQLEPRVLGFYNPIGGGVEVVTKIISQLAEKPVEWYRPCEEADVSKLQECQK